MSNDLRQISRWGTPTMGFRLMTTATDVRTNFLGTIIFAIGYCAYHLTGWGPNYSAYTMEAAQLRAAEGVERRAIRKRLAVDPALCFSRRT